MCWTIERTRGPAAGTVQDAALNWCDCLSAERRSRTARTAAAVRQDVRWTNVAESVLSDTGHGRISRYGHSVSDDGRRTHGHFGKGKKIIIIINSVHTYDGRERQKKKQLYVCNKRAFRSPQLASGARARTRSGGRTATDGTQCRQHPPKTTRVANIKTRFIIHRSAAQHVCFISLLLSLRCTFYHP